jgi:putative redox protein
MSVNLIFIQAEIKSPKDTISAIIRKTIYTDSWMLYICLTFALQQLIKRTEMKHVVDLSWTDKVAFETDMDGHKVIIDAGEESGGSDLGPRPKKLMLTSLAGCTGIDVVMILKKMKVEVEGFNVIVEGELTEEHPKYYHTIKVIYQFKGKNLPMDKLEKAVQLSEDKYCGVSALYRKAVKMEREIRVVE